MRRNLSLITSALGILMILGSQIASNATSIGSNCYAGPATSATVQVKANGWLSSGKPAGTLALYFSDGTYFTGNFSSISVVKASNGTVTGSGLALGYYCGRYAAIGSISFVQPASGAASVTISVCNYYHPSSFYKAPASDHVLSGFVSLQP